jgi:hypothetical protein
MNAHAHAPVILDAIADDAATVNGWSDRNPATIVARTAKTIKIQRDRTSHMSSPDSIESGRSFAQGRGDLVIFQRDYDAPIETYSLRNSLRGQSLTVGRRDYYRDPSF